MHWSGFELLTLGLASSDDDKIYGLYFIFCRWTFHCFGPKQCRLCQDWQRSLTALLADKVALTKVLLRHVIPAKVESKDVTAGPVLTVGGETITAGVFTETSGTTITFTNAEGVNTTVIKADVQATNRVAHSVDTVI